MWKASTATIPVAVTATLAALSTARRGLRATSRSPSSSGTGSRREIVISVGRRAARPWRAACGQCADRAGAGGADGGHERRGQRHRQRHGQHLASDGQGERRRAGRADQPAPGLVISGAASQPTASPAAAASQRQDQVLGQQHDRDQPGVPPTALSSPTRRVLLRHPARRPARPRWRSPAARPARRRATGPAARPATSWPSVTVMSCHGVRRSARPACCGIVPQSCALAKAGAAAGSLSFRFSK